MIYQCKFCEFNCDATNTEKMIDHIYSHSPLNDFRLTREEAKDLRKYIYDNGYVSYEFHFPVIAIIKRLDKYLGE